ncbi:MAG: MerR family transcriptional regulator [Devosia sp.]|uniref:MerR family transcriptional regulator n=1 Tax=Devosia sp. TaxID=1871048 RepID=UPI001AC0B89E|nr:MerR family transcriptional regulator [Devosia sp.]MBN9311178.1 MerR family transcriptional regulator [Devosia sp.]MBN9317777.1 MerR family transcriptional regulator [Devosia sp.]
MDKSPDAFRTISEAAEELDLPQHVLRFWETRFSTIKPLKRGGGRRYYRPEDVLLLKGIRHLLYDQGFTIKGVQRILKDQGIRYVVGIGEGRPVESLPTAGDAADEVDFVSETAVMPEPVSEAADAVEGHAAAPRGLKLPSFRPAPKPAGLSAADRDKLSDVLRELLDCKRMLERAREG